MQQSDATNQKDALVSELTGEWSHLLNESLRKIEHCVSQLNQDQIWERVRPELNSVGNLILHLAGNLRQWAVTGMRGMVDDRDRAAEFAHGLNVPAADLIRELSAIIGQAQTVIAGCSLEDLMQRRKIQGFTVSGLQALSHTVNHFVGHTHQIILLTRLTLGAAYQFLWTDTSPRDRVPI